MKHKFVFAGEDLATENSTSSNNEAPSFTSLTRSTVIRWSNGRLWVVNCGEGTQRSFLEHNFAFNRVDVVLITDLSAEHALGLPGFMAMLMFKKTNIDETIYVFGPSGIKAWLLNVFELTDTFFKKLNGLKIVELNEKVNFNPTMDVLLENHLHFPSSLNEHLMLKTPAYNHRHWYLFAFQNKANATYASANFESQVTKERSAIECLVEPIAGSAVAGNSAIYILIESQECVIDRPKMTQMLGEHARDPNYLKPLASGVTVTLPDGKVVKYCDILIKKEPALRCWTILPKNIGSVAEDELAMSAAQFLITEFLKNTTKSAVVDMCIAQPPSNPKDTKHLLQLVNPSLPATLIYWVNFGYARKKTPTNLPAEWLTSKKGCKIVTPSDKQEYTI